VQSGENFASLTQLLSQFLGWLAVCSIGRLPDRPIAWLPTWLSSGLALTLNSLKISRRRLVIKRKKSTEDV